MNRSLRTLVRLALVALIISAGRHANAEDFEFQVPVKVEKLDNTFTQGKVSCSVYGSSHSEELGQVRMPMQGTYGVIGSGEGTFPITKGAYEGSVAVKFWTNRPNEPTNARDYACRLSLVSRNSVISPCVVMVAANQVIGRTAVTDASKIAAIQPCTTGKVPLPAKP